LAVAEIASEPAFVQTFVPEGLVVPEPVGDIAKDTWYWVEYVMVCDVVVGTLMVPEDVEAE